MQEKIARFGEYPAFAGFFFGDVEPDPAELDVAGRCSPRPTGRSTTLEPFDAETIEAALRAAAERLELKPRQAFQPIRVAVTGSRVSPGLFESLELLGREATLSRLRAAAAAV